MTRYGPWKIEFSWIKSNLFTGMRTSMNVPLVVNPKEDPFERAPFESDLYRRWAADKLWTLVPAGPAAPLSKTQTVGPRLLPSGAARIPPK